MPLTEQEIGELFKRLHEQTNYQKENAVICNVCGAEMIKRKSKFSNGFWWGCSNFPSCKNKFS